MKSFLPSMFYYGFPVVLLTTIDKDGNADVETPMLRLFRATLP